MRTLTKTCLFLMVASLLMVSCQKTELERWEGTYSYKISGRIELLPDDPAEVSEEDDDSGEEQENPVPFWLDLTPEEGQMHVVTDVKDEHQMLLTFNAILGDAYSCTAVESEGVLSVSGNPKKMVSVSSDRIPLAKRQVNYAGQGRLTGDVAVFTLTYSGEMDLYGHHYKVSGCEVECIATKN